MRLVLDWPVPAALSRRVVAVSTLLVVLVGHSVALAASGTVQGSIFCDADHSVSLTPGDVPLNGVTVRVSVDGGPGAETTTPDAATPGHYLISVVWAGNSSGSATVEIVAGLPPGTTSSSEVRTISPGGTVLHDFPLDCICGVPTPSSIDTLSCYKVADLKNPKFAAREGLVVADQLSTRPVDVKKPDLLCIPATQDGAGMGDPATNVCCYKLKGPKLPAPAAAQVSDRYGSLQLKIKKSALLCQPCNQALLP